MMRDMMLDGTHDLTELQRRSERQRKALAQAAKREPTVAERRT